MTLTLSVPFCELMACSIEPCMLITPACTIALCSAVMSLKPMSHLG